MRKLMLVVIFMMAVFTFLNVYANTDTPANLLSEK